MGKLKCLRGELKVWNKEVFGDMRLGNKQVIAKNNEIDNLGSESSLKRDLKEERVSLKGPLADLITKESVS